MNTAIPQELRARRAPAATIFLKEIRELCRDRRAVFFAFVLPLFLYPALFLGLAALPGGAQDEIERMPLRIGVAGEPWILAASIRDDDRLETVAAAFDEPGLRDGSLALHISILPEGNENGPPLGGFYRRRAILRYLETSAYSLEARRRAHRVLERVERDLLERRFEQRGVSLKVEELVSATAIDLSTARERSGALLGRILPLLLIILLITGGSFAAIDLLAGEKERGTLETLCVQAISTASIVRGKFLVVLACSIASVVLNLTGLALSASLGIGARSFGNEALVAPPFGAMVLALLFLAPFAVLTSAVLLAISAYARSYREAQTYILPLVLLALVPIGLSISPEVRLSSVAALVPVANVALSIREAIGGGGELHPPNQAGGWAAHDAALALRKAAELLGREEVVLGLERPPLAGDAGAEGRERRALAFGSLMLLLVYFAGSWLQTREELGFPAGLALTLWGVVLMPGLIYAAWSRRPLSEALALRRTPASNLLGALLLGGAAAILVSAWYRLQDTFLPAPVELEEAARRMFEEVKLGGLIAFLLFALSPGICEEVCWRGAFQGDLEPRGRPLRAALIVGCFFGLFHLSLHRFVPTALVGVLLAAVRQRTGSLFPCIALHTAYNATVLFLLPSLASEGAKGISSLPLLMAAGFVATVMWHLLRGAERPPPIDSSRPER
jgi:sodium transport system permease protein